MKRPFHQEFELPAAPISGKATTHEQSGAVWPSPSGEDAGPCDDTSSPVDHAGRINFRALLRALANVEVGDWVAGLCVAILFVGALYAPLFFDFGQ